MAKLHVFSTQPVGTLSRMEGNLSWYPTEFFDCKPSKEQLDIVPKLAAFQLERIKNSCEWEALSYWNKPKENGEPQWDEPTCVAMLRTFKLRQPLVRQGQSTSGVAIEESKLASVMRHSQLALYRRAMFGCRTIASIKAEFWKNEYNRQFKEAQVKHKIDFRANVEAFRKTRRSQIMQAIMVEIIQPKIVAQADERTLRGVQKLFARCVEYSMQAFLDMSIPRFAFTKGPPARLVEAHEYAKSIGSLIPRFLRNITVSSDPHVQTLRRVFNENIGDADEICFRMAIMQDEPFPTFRKLKKTFSFEKLKAVIG
eukprot:2646145-Rhodomonas_salina.2